MYNILVCDDDKEIVEAVCMYLSNEGYKTFSCYRGKDSLDVLASNKIDLVIMDVMMPGDDGIKTTVNIRHDYNVPILLLSAKSEDSDKILGLNVGADDYLTKPFNPLELIARVKSLIRRNVKLANAEDNSYIYRFADLMIDDDKKLVTVADKPVRLTPTEYNILLLMMKNQGKVFSSAEIYKSIWHQETEIGVENVIAVHIAHIREKIESDPKNAQYIKVVWGVGYKLGNS